ADEPLYMKNQKTFDKESDRFFGVVYKAKMLSRGVRHSRKKRLAKNYSINSNYYLDDNRRSIFSNLKFDGLKVRLLERYKKFTSDVDLDQEFVYFPLHFEPEKTSNPDGGHFYQVYDSISALRHLVPPHIPIYIKEHYSQFSRMLPGHRGKSPYLYDVLSALPNVYLLNTNISSNVLMSKALVTVSQTGTACLEAACSGNKAILMGYTWFNDTPNIINFSDINDFEEILNRPNASKDDIKSSMSEWVDNCSIPMIISPSNLAYFKQKFGEEQLSMLFSDQKMITQFVDAIWNDINTNTE
ncbi:hypothetical protein AB4517_18755, partial [Vibrio sp. 10N.222.52.C3]|uniref:hypothetical protein n=1 Tax=Vibrio sp. 10N.222.52.C3 TaxID=3229631 RepID=UPI00354C7F73